MADGAPVESGTHRSSWDEVTTLLNILGHPHNRVDTVFEELDAELESEFEEAGYLLFR